jgi:hypothetical protein
MKPFNNKIVRDCLSCAFALVALVGALASSAAAKAKTTNETTEPAEQVTVVAHVPLPGAAVHQMFVQQQGSKQYLYIQQASKEGFTVIEVTKPDHPKIIKREAWPNTASGGQLQMVGGGLALAEAPEKGSGSTNARHELVPSKTEGSPNSGGPATESVRVLDLSDPANPKTLQTFDGVTNVLADDGRRLIYITNGEGLWILTHKRARPPLPLCDSESVFSPIADCQ